MSPTHKQSFRPQVEALEDRTLLTSHVTAVLHAGVLRIDGTNQPNRIIVREVQNRIRIENVEIKVDGGKLTHSVSVSAVKKIEIHAGAGGDYIDLNSGTKPAEQPIRVAAAIWGGAGNDVILGEAGNEFIDGGPGYDTARVVSTKNIHNVEKVTLLNNTPPTGMIAARATIRAAVEVDPLQVQVDHLFSALNDYRVGKGLAPVKLNAQLNTVARLQAESLVRIGHLTHIDDRGRNLAARLRAVGYNYSWGGENIHQYDPFLGNRYSLAHLSNYYLDGWKASPEHNVILLAPQAVEAGIAIVASPSGAIYADLILGSPD
jgi:uncharacterized protein YkwD